MAALPSVQTLLAQTGVGVSLSDATALGSAFGADLFLALAALLGLGIGGVIRHTALSVFFGVMFALNPIVDLVPTSWRNDIIDYLLVNAGTQIFTTVNVKGALAPWNGLALFALYAAALAGFLLIDVRDAWHVRTCRTPRCSALSAPTPRPPITSTGRHSVFWDRGGASAVQRINLTAGQSVLDLCCGTGASALPAARAVGPTCEVLGIDIAESLLAKARYRARQQGLVRPGGHLAITTWGGRVLEPGGTSSGTWSARSNPSLYKAFNPWDSVSTVPAVKALFADGGTTPAEAEAVAGERELARPEDFWDIVLGTGYGPPSTP